MFKVLITFLTLVVPALYAAQQTLLPALESLKYTYQNADHITRQAVGAED